MDEGLEKKLKKAWEKDLPACLSCSWCPAFHEIDDRFYETDKPGEYHACCVNPNYEDSSSHRGHYLYPESEPEKK